MSNNGIVRFGMAALLVGMGLGQSGCKGCGKAEAPPAPPSSAPTAAPEPSLDIAPVAAPGTATAAAEEPPAYPGPRSEAPDGWRVTTGFASAHDKPLAMPQALEDNRLYVTALDPGGHPVGQLERFERGDMHGFLLARDMRQALYAFAEGPLRQGADARALTFTPREGGDHALVVVFKPVGGAAHVVSTPLTIQGALPDVMGPGVASLGARARTPTDHLQMATVPPQPIAGQPVAITCHDVDDGDTVKSEVRLPFVVILNDQMGWGDVVEWGTDGMGHWQPRWPGTYLVLAPPTPSRLGKALSSNRALAFRLTVIKAP